jgi:hypothetical protein
MAVSEIAIAGVAALIVLMAALVLVLSIPDRGAPGSRRPKPARLTPPPAQVPRGWAEHPGPFGQEKEEHGGPVGYGRPPGYGPPPLWSGPRGE